ncbi:MAG: hypothetical protein ACE5J7_00220 [Candidatus Aenigmatarchaeota archaeon]
MRGTSYVVMLGVSVLIAVLTLILIYVVFPRSHCDELAQLSAQEIKRAIECAANYEDYRDPITGRLCNAASVKLCQEDTFSVYGVGYVQAYLGLMVPEYMVYYKQFPKKRVHSIFTPGIEMGERFSMSFSESYPFERAYLGQRPWDIRPTLTQFKEFFKTKYLEQPCTSENALCFNIRGREEVVKIDAPSVKNVRIARQGMGIAETNPRFYIVAPCYAKVKFVRGDSIFLLPEDIQEGEEEQEDIIYGYVDRCGAGDASNYCYTDEGTLSALVSAYAAETTCYALDYITDILSFGTKAGVKAGAKAGVKTAGKKVGREVSEKAAEEMSERIAREVMQEAEEHFAKTGQRMTGKQMQRLAAKKGAQVFGREIGEEAAEEIATDVSSRLATRYAWKSSAKGKLLARASARRAGKMFGIPTSGAELTRMLAPLPCVDIDYCRGAGSCAEAAALWPGWPFKPLTESSMPKCRSYESASAVLMPCCLKYEYGAEKNISRITCENPSDLVDLLKPDMGLEPKDNVTLKNLANYLRMSEDRIDVVCSLVKGNSTKECIDALEVREHHLWDTCSSFDSHTYDFERVRDETTLTVSFGGFGSDCQTEVATEISKDKKEWETLNETTIQGYPEVDRIVLKGEYSFRYLRIRDTEERCHLDWSFVALGSEREGKIEAVKGVDYNLAPFRYVYFIVPPDYSTQASVLCEEIEHCDSIAAWVATEGSWLKYYAEAGKEDFIITGGDEIGIYTTDYSKVRFGEAAPEEGVE